MKILQICLRVPYPPKDGGCVAMNNLTQGFGKSNVMVKVVAINTLKHYVNLNSLPEWYVNQTKIEATTVNTEVKAIGALLNIFSNKSYNIERFYNKEFEQLLINTLQKESFDIVHFESVFTAPYFDAVKKYCGKAKLILRTHNIEHKIWEGLFDTEKNILKKQYLKLLAGRLKTYETNCWPGFDAVVNITEADSNFVSKYIPKEKVFTTPFGLDAEQFEFNLPNLNTLFHLGALDWLPNQQGITWFLENCWEALHKEFPALKFYIAGRNAPDWLKNLKYPNVKIVGEVEHAHEFMQQYGYMVVPLFSGSGMRTKIIEGMAMGKIVITTTLGAQGINCHNNENILIADTAEDFIAQIKKSQQNKETANQISNKARKLVEQHYDSKLITEKLLEFYKKLLN